MSRRLSASSVLLWGMVVVAAAYFVYLTASDWLRKVSDTRFQEFLDKIAAEINRLILVMIVQENEIMTAVVALRVLSYNYSMVNILTAQVNHNRFAAEEKERLREGACNRPETRDNFLKKDVTLRYSYFDKDKQHIATVDVTPADCGF